MLVTHFLLWIKNIESHFNPDSKSTKVELKSSHQTKTNISSYEHMKIIDSEIEKYNLVQFESNHNLKPELIMFSGVDDELQQIHDKLSEVKVRVLWAKFFK